MDMPGVDIEGMRHAWRREHGRSLDRRRRIAALALLGAADFSLGSLFQLGIVKRLPDLPFRVFDAAKVIGSHKAYALGVPDAPVAALVNTAEVVLAGIGGTKKTGRPKWANALLALAALGGAIGAVDYLSDMIFRKKVLCPYCLVGAGINFAILPLAIRELRDA